MTNIIALQTDYGKGNPRINSIKDVLYQLSPGCEIYDAVHELLPGDIVAASIGIYSALQFYPQGTVYLSDVKDSVPCRLCAAKTKDGHFIVTPDNGTLSQWYNFFGLEEVREVKDLAIAAARIALDSNNFKSVGPKYKLSEIVLFKAMPPVIEKGCVQCSMLSIVKGFGNLNLYVTYEEFEKSGIKYGDYVDVSLTKDGKEVFNATHILYAKSFGYVEEKSPVLFNGSTGYMGFGLNLDNFCTHYIPEVYQDCNLTAYRMTIRKNVAKASLLMQTDFGPGGGSAMYGVCKTLDRELSVHDITHLIPKFDIQAASDSLMKVVPQWPSGTVFVSVVDPGVGTARKACVALLENGSYVVTPDNGTLKGLASSIVQVREIDETINRLPGTEKTSIFHGRDLFAYCGAKLASGLISFEQVGPAYEFEGDAPNIE